MVAGWAFAIVSVSLILLKRFIPKIGIPRKPFGRKENKQTSRIQWAEAHCSLISLKAESGLQYLQLNHFSNHCFLLLLLLHHQTASDHVVERLPFFGEGGHDVSDGQRQHAGNDFGEVAATCAGKAQRLALHVCHSDAEHLLADGGMVRATLLNGMVEPAKDKHHQHPESKCNHEANWEMRLWAIQRVRQMTEVVHAQNYKSHQAHHKRNQIDDQTIDEKGHQPVSKFGIG